jgi:hypothetical protein
MSANDAKPSIASDTERRVDGPVEIIDEAVVLATVEGVGPALDYMSASGVERDTALRVLSGPEHHREVDRGTVAKILHFLVTRLRREKH